MAKLLKLLFALLALALLYVALRGMDWGAFVAALAAVHLGWAIACLVLELFALAARAHRWDLLLAYRTGPRFLVAFVGEAVGDIGNTFLPARAGEPMRAILVARQLKVETSFVVGTAATERVSDAVFVSLLAFLMSLLVPHTPVWLMGVATMFFLLGITVLAVLFFLPVCNRIVFPLLERLRPLQPLLHKLETALTGVWQGSQGLFQRPQRLALYVTLTVLFWCLDGVAVLCLARAFEAQVSLPEAMLFLAALGLSAAIPSTPGYIGVYQFVAVSVLTPLGLTRVQALAIVLVYQISTILLQLVSAALGWLLLLRVKATET